ncbi:tail fiber assembly protein [Yersinia enterocolitica]|uniref:tail fiber assembly protein n=1 Tax=Yersinia enterocolitica TaxID=630 RepID=UPI0028960FFA|nr:tail fiber assembly protein [Yersinia enterocolitica]EKN3512065.1 tail fiber assembly protein [Yersinia enterocolitica]EKN4029659.1 tail fiber assembly protein [Yersinia enterocolitica]EKN4105129.1 tail fiber assembly protein [Yersinia enterocolitica]EKN5020843.1 tail assembly chaperone [Yersinia enterocolitica]
MNSVFFSPSTVGFYSDNLINDGSYDSSLPSDIIELTLAENEIYKGRNPPLGKMLGAINGRPAWVNLPPPTHEELIVSANAKKNQLKAAADSEIDWRQDAVDGAYAEGNEAEELAAWKKYRVLLMRIDSLKVPDILWPALPE